MKEQIARNKAKEDFLMGYRFAIPEDDFHIGITCYEWPKKMLEIMKEANFRANQEHKGFEAALKAQRVSFATRLAEFQKELEGYEKKNDMVKRDLIAAEVTALSEKLQEAVREAEWINSQEKLFSWSLTKYQIIGKVRSPPRESTVRMSLPLESPPPACIGAVLPRRLACHAATILIPCLSHLRTMVIVPPADDLRPGPLPDAVDQRQRLPQQLQHLDDGPLQEPQPRGRRLPLLRHLPQAVQAHQGAPARCPPNANAIIHGVLLTPRTSRLTCASN